MSDALRAEKAHLRQQLMTQLRNQSAAERQQRSEHVVRQVLQRDDFRAAATVMAYAALPYEVNTNAIIDAALHAGKRVALPHVDEQMQQLVSYAIQDRGADMETGRWQLRQPKRGTCVLMPAAEIDLILVPGVGFDREGRRIGHGRGYYDRWLAALPARTVRLGLAFDCQVVARVPVGAQDAVLTAVVIG